MLHVAKLSLGLFRKTMADLAGHLFVRVAGISGALAVGLGAYGAHGMKKYSDEAKEVFETANRYHFLHTLALLAVPLTGYPTIVGMLLLVGMLVFCGTCYFFALTSNPVLTQFTPYGGMTLIAAWAAMAF